MRNPILIAPLLLVGCSSMQLTPPAQPTPAAINTAISQMALITADPATVWEVGDYEVRASCHAYLNSAATKAAQVSQASAGAGALGAGLSIVNPLAGVASSLFQSFLSSYQAAGALPYTSETTTIISKALDDYGAQVSVALPSSTATAMSYIDDEWFMCSPGGYAELVAAAISTANIGGSSVGPNAPLIAAPRRPGVTVNGNRI
jgi:hypothetical protein